MINLYFKLHQPELRTKFLEINKKNNYFLNNRQIAGKLIKNKLSKKALNYLGKEYTEDYINIDEDAIFSITFFHLANSYYLMKEVGYVYFVYRKFKYYPDE